jgi:hypothetical protein
MFYISILTKNPKTMKRLITLLLIIFMAVRMNAQENQEQLYLLFEFMQVNDEQDSDYWQVEEFWSGIHKQRVADKTILGWDLWSLTPAGAEQGSQYMTVTLFANLKDMLQAATSWDVGNYVKKAYPDLKEKELNAMFEKTAKSRNIAHQVYLKQTDKTTNTFVMKVGTVATIDIMKQLDEGYEKAESGIFKPWHQEMVTKGKKGSWGLLRVILPAGSESYGTHLTVSMFNDAAQLAAFMENTEGGEMDLMTELAIKEGLKTREWKEVKIATLQKMVR